MAAGVLAQTDFSIDLGPIKLIQIPPPPHLLGLSITHLTLLSPIMNIQNDELALREKPIIRQPVTKKILFQSSALSFRANFNISKKLY